MLEVEERYKNFGRHEKIRIEQWSKKLCQVTTNTAWKRNRNLYAMLLTDSVLNGKLIKPFTLVPPDSHLPVLNKAEVNSQLSAKFKAFQKNLKSKSIDRKLHEDSKDVENQDPQLINIRANVGRSFDQREKSNNRERLSKFKKASPRREEEEFPKRYIIHPREKSRGNSRSRGSSKKRRHNFDPSLERKMLSHPLYKNEVRTVVAPKPKSKKRKGKLNLIKNTEREKLKEEVENERVMRLETFGPEPVSVPHTAREVEARDDDINKLKSEVEVLNITIKHLHDVLKEKTDVTMEQQREIIMLNQKINQLSFENTQLKAQNSLLSRRTHLEDVKFDAHDYSSNEHRGYSREEAKDYERADDAEKLRLIEETESLLNRSKTEGRFGYNYIDDEIYNNVHGKS